MRAIRQNDSNQRIESAAKITRLIRVLAPTNSALRQPTAEADKIA